MGKTADTSFALSRKDSGILDGYRNKIINGNFDIWQRGTTQTVNGYGSDDRWSNGHSGSTKTHSLQSFAAGQTDVPGNPTYFSRTVVNSVAGANNYVIKGHNIENVATLSGKKATITFYAKADANRNIAVEFYQVFGTSGSSPVSTPLGLVALTTSWKRYDIIVDIPNVVGKTLGNNHTISLQFWFDGGSSFASRASNLGQQSGTFDIARVSLVEGDASKESDPFSPRHIQQEYDLCFRYYEKIALRLGGDAFAMSAGEGRSATGILPFKQRKRGSPAILTNISGGNFNNVEAPPGANAWGVGCTGIGFSTTTGTVSIILYGGSEDYLVICVLSTQIFSPAPNSFATGAGIYIAVDAEL